MSLELPEFIKNKIEQFTPMQRAYCEYRARGLSQSQAAKKAGSTCEDKGQLGSIGYQIEQIDGSKDYIDWIKQERISSSTVDETELIHMLRSVYKEAMATGGNALKHANEAVKLIGEVAGILGRTSGTKATKEAEEAKTTSTQAFREEEADDSEQTQRMDKLQTMLKDLKKANNYNNKTTDYNYEGRD